MKKSLILCAALLACAFGFQSCDKIDNPGDPAETVIENGSDLADAIAKFAKEGELKLPAGVELTLNEEIELDAPLYIIGDKDKPAKIIASAGFVINSDFVLEGVVIEAAEVKTPFIRLATFELQEKEVAKNIGLVAFINSQIYDLKYQFIYANKQSYLVDCINVQKSIVAIDGANKKTTFDFNGGGNVAFLGIDESTIYSVPTVANNGGFFSSQSSKEVTDLGGTTQTFAISNSTLYNITNGKTVNTLRKNSQAYQKFAIKNSIIVNSGKSAQFLKGLNAGNAGKDVNWEVDGNCFNFGGAVAAEQKIGESDDNIKNSIDKVIAFADAEKGDFTQSQVTAGDPRWIANK